MHGSLNVRHLLRAELAQRGEAGYDTDGIAQRVADAGGVDGLELSIAESILDELDTLGRDPQWDLDEPEDLDDIRASSDWPESTDYAIDAGGYASDVERAWSGRVVGNMLGKPVENWSRSHIRSLLQKVGEWPLADYFPWLENTGDDLPDYVEGGMFTTRGRIDGSARDDDIDYTILNLSVLLEYGPDFTTTDIGVTWLERLPFLKTYTAERVALRNMARGVAPDRAAEWRNPYREFIGAAIRADIFGLVAPGDPALAASLAYRDAVISHTANGVYGEMFCASLVAAAFSSTSVKSAVSQALRVVPQASRLHVAIKQTLDWFDEGLEWNQTRDRIDQLLGHYSPVHTISNGAILVAGLLYGDRDFDRSITLTVAGGLDTDSNGATAGTVGALLAHSIPERWTEPLHDTIHSAVFGYDTVSISKLARYSVDFARDLRRGTTTTRIEWHHGAETW